MCDRCRDVLAGTISRRGAEEGVLSFRVISDRKIK